MDKGFAVLEIDPEFKTLIRPLRKDEYLQLEVNLAVFSASVFALPFSTLASTLTLVSPKLRKRRLLPSAGKLIMRRQ